MRRRRWRGHECQSQRKKTYQVRREKVLRYLARYIKASFSKALNGKKEGEEGKKEDDEEEDEEAEAKISFVLGGHSLNSRPRR